MSKFYATVCLPPVAAGDALAALADALRPYDLEASEAYVNDKGEWDWWIVQSPEGEELPVYQEFDCDSHLIHGATYPDGRPRKRRPRRCDGAPKALLDLAKLRRDAVSKAQRQWRAWTELSKRHPDAQPLSHFLAIHAREPDAYSEAWARRDYLAQPLVQDVVRRAAAAADPDFGREFLALDPLEYFAITQQGHVDRAAILALATFAMITVDGRWLDVEQPGTSTILRPPQVSEVQEFMSEYIEGLDEDNWLVTVLCHS